MTGYYLMRRNHVKAREWSDRYLKLGHAPYYAIGLATDGLLLASENRHSDAKLRFSASLERLSELYPPYQDYVSGYGQLWLSIIASAESRTDFEQSGGSANLVGMRDELANGSADDWLKKRLPLPDRDKLDLWKDDEDPDNLKGALVGSSVKILDFQSDF